MVRALAALLASSVLVGCELASPTVTPAPPRPTAAATTASAVCAVPGSSTLPAAACDVLARARTETTLVVAGAPGAATGALTDAFEQFFGLVSGRIRYDLRGTGGGADLFGGGPRTLAALDAPASGGASVLASVAWERVFGLRADDLIAGGKAVWSHVEVPAGLVYNATLVRPEDLPKTYRDLLDARWKGKIVMARSSVALGYAALALADVAATGDGLRLAQGLAGSPPGTGQVRFASGPDEVRQRVASGEVVLGFGADAGARGAPLAEAGIEPIPLSLFGFAVAKDAKSPVLAQLFAYFVATPEGQVAFDAAFGKARHTTAGSRVARYIGTKKVIVPTFELERSLAALDARFDPILGVR